MINVLCVSEDLGLVTKSVPQLNEFGGADINAIQVLKSAAGFYIGSLYKESDQMFYPFMRDSDCYWNTREEAEDALRTGNYPVKF